MIYEIILISVVGAFLSLDRTAFLQSMVAQPIIIAPIIGAIAGDFSVGLKIGVAFELLWVSVLPLGTYIPPDDTLTSILATACTVIGIRTFAHVNVNAFIALNILLLIPVGYAGRAIDTWIRNRNKLLMRSAEKSCEAGNLKSVEFMNLKGLLNFFTINLLTIAFLLGILLPVLSKIYEIIPVFLINEGMGHVYTLILIIGVALLLVGNRVKSSLKISTVSFLSFSILLELF